MAKIAFFVSEDWYFVAHWQRLAVQLRERGHDVILATNLADHRKSIENAGIPAVSIGLDRLGLDPLADLALARRLTAWLNEERPDILHSVGIKPILYGSIAAARSTVEIAVVNHFAGLGYVFSSPALKAKLLRPLVRAGMKFAIRRVRQRCVVMNPDDLKALTASGIAPPENIKQVTGNGIDLARFHPMPEPKTSLFMVAVAARMIKEKGIACLVDGFRILKEREPKARLLLAGKTDSKNPDGISTQKMNHWCAEPGIAWLGHVKDVRELWKRAHVAVLPSRREGLPVSLMEAAACGRPLVGSDVPGCREIVVPDMTGFLVPPDDPQALADALWQLSQDEGLRQRMGAAGRHLVEQRFGVHSIADQIDGLYRELLGQPASADRHSAPVEAPARRSA